MLLKRIRLFNIRSYLDESIEFPSGSLLLSGDIGSGKSSILLAVEFALFGTRKGVGGEVLLRHGKKEGFAELVFSLDGKEILIRRALKRGKDGVKQEEGFIIADDVKSNLTAEDLKARILDLLGYPAEFLKRNTDILFRYTVYTPQEEMKKILMDDPEQRLDTLRKVFSVDKYKKIGENARLIVRDIRERKRELEGKTYDLEYKKQQARHLESELQGLQETLKAGKQKLMLVQEAFDFKRQELKRAEQSVKVFRELQKSMEVLQAKFSEKYEQLQGLNESIKGLVEEIEKLRTYTEATAIALPEQELETKIDSNNMLLITHTEKRTRVEGRLEHVRQMLAELEQEVARQQQLFSLLEQKKKQAAVPELSENLQEQLMNCNETLVEVKAEAAKLKADIAKSETLRQTISKLERCPLCLQHVDAEHKQHIITTESEAVAVLGKALADTAERQKELMQKISALAKKIERYAEQEKLAHRVKIELEHLQNEIARIEQRKGTIEKSRQELQSLQHEQELLQAFNVEHVQQETSELNKRLRQIRELKSSLSLLELKEKHLRDAEQHILAIKGDIGKLNVQKSEVYKQLEHCQEAEQHYVKAYEHYEAGAEELKQKQIQVAELQKEISAVHKQVRVLDEEISVKIQLRERLHDLNSLEHWLDEFFANLMETMEKHVMLKVYAEFNEFFQQWFRTLIEDENINVRLDESYTPIIEQNGYETAVDNLSGGERTSCALAYRLALNKVINDVVAEIKTKDIIILDEPTDGFSSEQLDKVRAVLDQLGVRQVILVSHEAKIESFVQHIVRIGKNEHVSNVI